ncbi:MAG: response regulator [Magnetococcales bacterium]|nr:response regulator [Magnetococcales bacterium]
MKEPILSTDISTSQEDRLNYLEELSRWNAFALDLVASMVRLHQMEGASGDTSAVLIKTRESLHRLLDLKLVAFFQVDEESEFFLADCEPEEMRSYVLELFEKLVEGGEFAWALRQNQVVRVQESAHRVVILHALATQQSISGMFMGVVEDHLDRLSSPAMNLLSILLNNTASALENARLQQRLQEANLSLEKRVEEALTFITAQNRRLQDKVTALKSAEKEILEAKQIAEEANLAKSRFLATMSHEIRTPMNAIIGMAQVLGETELTPQQEHYVSIFRNAGESLLTLINDILDLSKIEAGKVQLENEPFDLRALVDEAVQMFSLRAHAKGLKLQVKVDESVPSRQWGDANRLRQILVNLLGNALKFTHKGRIEIILELVKDNQFLSFSIKDTGIGIPPEKYDLIFTEFMQADSSTTRQYGGTGLGLTICKRLVDAMGGRIQLQSVVDKGSTFQVLIPAHTPGPLDWKEGALEEEGGEKGIPKVAPGRLRVLLVEDSEDNALLIKIFLKKGSHKVELVENGQKALEKFQKDSFDLVLMDMQMPVMDGFQATRAIRQWESQNRKKPTPIIALTAYAMKEDRQRCLEAGCDIYLAKPVRKQALMDAIGRVFYRSQGKSSEASP